MLGTKLFTELLVYGSPRRQWRVIDGNGGIRIVKARILPDGPWIDVEGADVRAEILHGTEAGKWLAKMTV